MGQQYWYEEPREEEIPQDTKGINAVKFDLAVKEILNQEGNIGYQLGTPELFNNAVWIQICFLDPQNQLPQEVRAFIQNKVPFEAGAEIPVMADSFEYKYDSQSDTYVFGINHERILKDYPNNMITGSFNRKCTIQHLELQYETKV